MPASQVAEWAGHSIAMLLNTDAKCIEGQEQEAKKKIESVFGSAGEDDSSADADGPGAE
ncbi:MAG: hypothetical protein HOV87_19940 [Catenulispora sp.]|nr:hypothetical protein [Catenulispora sp.]